MIDFSEKINCEDSRGKLICMLFREVWGLLRETEEEVKRYVRWVKQGGGSAVWGAHKRETFTSSAKLDNGTRF